MAIPFGIGGIWHGQYSYLPDFGAAVPNGSIRFTLTARPGWLGRFRGVIDDDPAAAIPVSAQVRGRVSGASVAFAKRYPVCYVSDGYRSVSLREFLKSNHGLEIDEEVPSTPVFYTGRFDPTDEVVRGMWRFDGEPLRVRSGGVSMQCEVQETCGTWSMSLHSFL